MEGRVPCTLFFLTAGAGTSADYDAGGVCEGAGQGTEKRDLRPVSDMHPCGHAAEILEYRERIKRERLIWWRIGYRKVVAIRQSVS